MAKTAKIRGTRTFPKPSWRVVAIASLVLNAGLVGGWLYLLHYNQYPLIQAEINQRCTEPGYTRLMHQIDEVTTGSQNSEQNKKFAAASLCFVDYETGKSIDLDSVKPKTDSPASLPARP